MIQTLGALQVTENDQPVQLGGPLQRTVLARLIVAYPDSVSVDQLTETLWNDDPPRQAAVTLQVYISRLRKSLPANSQIVSGGHGYRLVAEPEQLDWILLRNETRRAVVAAAADRHGEVIAILQPALSPGRSLPALQPFTEEPWAIGFCEDLGRTQLQAVELLGAAYLAARNPEAAIEPLEAALTAHPASESTAELLMTAYYRCGRQSRALDTYHRLRIFLDDELGLEPRRRLKTVFDQVLRHDPVLDWHPAATQAPRLLPPRPTFLVGREQVIDDVTARLTPGGRAVIAGLAGIGKTAVAAEIAHRHDGLVCWIPAEDASGLTAITELATRLGISPLLSEPDLLSALWRALQEWPGWLLIFDNAVSAALISRWLPPVGNGAVLVTSRSPAWTWVGPVCRLEPLDVEAAMDFVVRRAGRAAGDRTALVAAMGGVALALEQACGYIDETGMTIDRYLQIFSGRQRELLSRGAPTSHPDPVVATWDMLVSDIRSHSELALAMLEVASLLSGDELALELLTRASGERPDDLLIEDALGHLVRFSLVDRDTTVVRLHPLVQEVVRAQIPQDRYLHRVGEATQMLSSRLPGNTVDLTEQRQAWSMLLPHVFALVRTTSAAPHIPTAVVLLAIEACWYLRSRQANGAAKELCAGLATCVEQSRTSPAATVEVLASQADLLDADGHLREAQSVLRRARTLLAGVPNPSPLTVARLSSLHGHALNCADRGAEAIIEYERASEMLAGLGRPAELAVARIGLGYSRWSVRDFVGAEREFKVALREMTGDEWLKHPLRIEAVSGLGMMRHEQGAVSEAIELQSRALTDSIDLYGMADHPVTAHIHAKIGYEFGLSGRHAESLRHHECAAEMLQRLYGPEDPRLAMVISNRGLAELACGRPDTARASQQQALRMLQLAYGPDHRDTRLVTARLADL